MGLFGHTTIIGVDKYKVYRSNEWGGWFENQSG
jgi:hypothetical protein